MLKIIPLSLIHISMDIGFISAGSGIIGLNNLTHDQIVLLVNSLNELNNLADYIIIDTGAGISDSVLEFVAASPEILLVTTPEPSSLTDAYSCLLYTSVPFTTLVPAFILSELRTAFILGFLIYIPFIVIDMVVSSVLMSMGMMMLPPTTISLPFKMCIRDRVESMQNR